MLPNPKSDERSKSDSLVLQTRDMDEATAVLSTCAVPYRAELLNPASFSTRIFGAATAKTQLSRVQTLGAMRVKAELPADTYAMVIGISGEMEHHVAGKVVCVCPECGLLQSPSQAAEVRTPDRFELMFLRFDRKTLTAELEKLLMREVTSELVFSPEFTLKSEAGQRIRRAISSLWSNLQSAAGKERDQWLTAASESELILLLLDTQRHNYSRLLARYRSAGPWQVRAAEEYICANAELALSMADVAMASGVSVRTLQHSFRQKRGYSPMQFLRSVRLERVHQGLSQADDTTTVTETASLWGFLHFGRFAREYQKRFGEKPSDTLRKSQRQA